jgi:hypothetical protein
MKDLAGWVVVDDASDVVAGPFSQLANAVDFACEYERLYEIEANVVSAQEAFGG